MSETPLTPTPRAVSLSRAFHRLGWIGFWVQIVFGSLPVLLMVYYFTFTGTTTASRSGLPFIEYLTAANLLILLFTLYWSYGYTRLSWRIVDPARSPSAASLTSAVWTGVISSTAGLFLTTVVLMIEGANLLFSFLKAPQGGFPVVQVGGAMADHLVSSIDMVSLMALILTLFAELLVLVFSLWLLARTTRSVLDDPKPGDDPSGEPRAGELALARGTVPTP